MTPTSKRATALTSPRRQRGPSLTRLLPGQADQSGSDEGLLRSTAPLVSRAGSPTNRQNSTPVSRTTSRKWFLKEAGMCLSPAERHAGPKAVVLG